ncbi:hypothetical protein P7C70_g5007, partial [Phenoliferia sp. Uapishka_3]
MKMPLADIHETFTALTTQLKAAHPNLAVCHSFLISGCLSVFIMNCLQYVHVVESRVSASEDVEERAEEDAEFLRKIVTSPTVFIAAGSFKAENSVKYAEEHKNSLVAFGRYFVSNPDLPARIEQGVELAPYNRDTFYLQGPTHPEGYTDYPRATKA